MAASPNTTPVNEPLSVLGIRDTLDEVRHLVQVIFMAADALDPQDGNAISTVADLAAQRLNQVQKRLAGDRPAGEA